MQARCTNIDRRAIETSESRIQRNLLNITAHLHGTMHVCVSVCYAMQRNDDAPTIEIEKR